MKVHQTILLFGLSVFGLSAPAVATASLGDFTPGTGAELRTSTNYLLADTLAQFVVGESTAPDNTYSCGRIEHGVRHSDIHIPTINEIKSQPTYSHVDAYAKIVTAGTDQLYRTFYIGESDRLSGLRVNMGGNPLIVSAGDMVDVSGVIKGSGVDCYIDYPEVTVRFPSVAQLAAFFMANRGLGGEGTDVLTGGARNVNLLVQTSGIVTYVDTATPIKFFYVDDGSGLSDGLVFGGQTTKGIRVSITSLATGNTILPPAIGQYVSVTGICAPQTVAGGKVLAQIRPRDQGDVVVLALP
ncbi:MAG: hypothetical protein Q7T82_00920 [Armatimonadota bacterium]|nr:hypothetical protein [Armatimonadota bacterium]